MALLPTEQMLLIESATGPWCLPMFLELSAATGARRGEVLALRWSDIDGSDVVIARSLTQTRKTLEFKSTKTERPRRVNLPQSVVVSLEGHRKRQDEFRQQFGPDYRGRLGFDIRESRWYAAEARFGFGLRIAALPAPGLPKGASLHTLRHSHGSVLLADGVDLATVSERLGHSSVRVTADIYSHALRGRDQEAAQRWDEFMRRNGGSREGGAQAAGELGFFNSARDESSDGILIGSNARFRTSQTRTFGPRWETG